MRRYTIFALITNKYIARYAVAGVGLLLVPIHLLFTITAEEEGERFLVRLWNSIRSVIVTVSIETKPQWWLGAVGLERRCAKLSCQTTLGARAASRREQSGRWRRQQSHWLYSFFKFTRCIVRHTASWSFCLQGSDRGWKKILQICQSDENLPRTNNVQMAIWIKIVLKCIIYVVDHKPIFPEIYSHSYFQLNFSCVFVHRFKEVIKNFQIFFLNEEWWCYWYRRKSPNCAEINSQSLEDAQTR